MSKEDLEFPGEPIVRVKDPSALEFPEVPREQTGGAKHDLKFPEGEEAQEAKSVQGKGDEDGLRACPRPGRVFSRLLTAVAAVALVGLGVAAVRPLDGRLLAVLVASLLVVVAVVAGVVACGGRYAR